MTPWSRYRDVDVVNSSLLAAPHHQKVPIHHIHEYNFQIQQTSSLRINMGLAYTDLVMAHLRTSLLPIPFHPP